jgi:hypothetical protein
VEKSVRRAKVSNIIAVGWCDAIVELGEDLSQTLPLYDIYTLTNPAYRVYPTTPLY